MFEEHGFHSAFQNALSFSHGADGAEVAYLCGGECGYRQPKDHDDQPVTDAGSLDVHSEVSREQ